MIQRLASLAAITFCGTFLFTTLLWFSEVCGFFVHSSLKVPPQDFSRVEVWT